MGSFFSRTNTTSNKNQPQESDDVVLQLTNKQTNKRESYIPIGKETEHALGDAFQTGLPIRIDHHIFY